MTRLVALLVLAGLMMMSVGAFANTPDAADDALVRDRTEAISKTLRCVVCQNQSIYDSNAPLAEDMRRLVEKRVREGDSDEDVRVYMRERYGDYVLMTPPLQGNTYILWLGPVLLLLAGGAWFLVVSRQNKTNVPPEEPLSEHDRKRVEQALKSGDTP